MDKLQILGQTETRKLAEELSQKIRGEVRFDDGSRALYASDASNYRQIPIGVVIPEDKEDLLQTLAICREHHAPLLLRGSGTSLAGQCCNAAVVLDLSKKFNRISRFQCNVRWYAQNLRVLAHN